MLLWTDWLIIIIILFSTLLSLRNGFFKELTSFIALLFGIYIALTYNEIISIQFNKIFGGNFLTPGYAMAGSFFIIMWIASKLKQKLRNKLKKFTIGPLDRLMGSIFGFLRGGILVTLLLAFSVFSIFLKTDEWKTTFITRSFQPLSIYFLSNLIPEKVLNLVTTQLNSTDQSYTFQKAKNIINQSFGADLKINSQVLIAGEKLEKEKEKEKGSAESADKTNLEQLPRIFQKNQRTLPVPKKNDREILLELDKSKTNINTSSPSEAD